MPPREDHTLFSASSVSCFRYDFGAEYAKDKERYAAKERDDVIRKSKERKAAEVKVRSSPGLYAQHIKYYACFMNDKQIKMVPLCQSHSGCA